MAMKLLRLLPVLALLAIPGAASAQITNGDFEAGSTGWLTSAPPGWSIEFPGSGGNPNGNARIVDPFGQPGGTACIIQSFDCGLPDPTSECTIEFDYRLQNIGQLGPLNGRVQVYVDGALRFQSPELALIEWTHISLALECGRHEIRLCLNVDPINNGILVRFDNVTAMCEQGVPAIPSTWGKLKALYK